MSWYRESELNQFEHVSSGVGKRHSLQGNLHQYWLVCRKHSGCTNILWLQQFLQEIYITGRVTNHKREGLSNSISDGLTVQIIMKVLTQSVILYTVFYSKILFVASPLIPVWVAWPACSAAQQLRSWPPRQRRRPGHTVRSCWGSQSHRPAGTLGIARYKRSAFALWPQDQKLIKLFWSVVSTNSSYSGRLSTISISKYLIDLRTT